MPFDQLQKILKPFPRHTVLYRLIPGLLTSGSDMQRLGRSFPDHAVPTNDGETMVPGPDGTGEVERGDHSNDPQRMIGFL